jgi:hypothetical protein
MEIGDSGWIPVGEGSYLNKHNGHTVDELGREYDEKGRKIYDPLEDDKSE